MKTLAGEINVRRYRQVTKQGTQNPEAYELYLKGRYSWNKRDLATAISYFNQAIAKDPGYALAYSGLADTYLLIASYDNERENRLKSKAAAHKALELDATLAGPHTVLGANEMDDWDFAGGEAEFKKALELDPSYATAHQWYGEKIAQIGGTEQEAEALAEINRAHQLDPLSLEIRVEVGAVYIYARQYDEAIAACKMVVSENPTFAMAHNCLAAAYWYKRMYPQAIEESKAFAQLSGSRDRVEIAAADEQGFRLGGWKGALTKEIEAEQAQRKRGKSGRAHIIAEDYADLGDKEQAFQWLNTAYQERDSSLIRLKTFPAFDPIRSDPRFAELVRKVGLPQ